MKSSLSFLVAAILKPKEMKLTTISTGSKGNAYILTDDIGESLLIELGVKYSEIQKALDFDFSNVAGAIVTHRHMDHSESIVTAINKGMRVHTVKDTIDFFDIKCEFNAVELKYQKWFKVGSFNVIALKAFHDVECAAFIINHPEMGNVLFATDTYKFPYKLNIELHNIIIEANYCEDILSARPDSYLSGRIIKSHMSIQRCIKTIMNQDISKVNNIVLIHLSDGNSHEEQFYNKVSDVTGKFVHVANKGMIINFNKTPF